MPKVANVPNCLILTIKIANFLHLLIMSSTYEIGWDRGGWGVKTIQKYLLIIN